jgi:hypothetical protein
MARCVDDLSFMMRAWLVPKMWERDPTVCQGGGEGGERGGIGGGTGEEVDRARESEAERTAEEKRMNIEVEER